MKQRALAIIVLSVAGVFALFWLAYAFAEANGVKLTIHTWIAIIIGTLVSFGLSALLFGLSFYSARSGHDDKIGPE